MPDETKPGQIPNEGSGSEHTETNPAQTATSQSEPASQKETFDAEYVKKLREEAARYRKELQQVTGDLKKRQDAELTETQKLQAERDAVKAERDQLAAKARLSDLQVLAAKAGAPQPELVARLVDPDADDLAAAIAEVKKAAPALFRVHTAGSADGNTSGRPAAPSMNDFIRRAAGRG